MSIGWMPSLGRPSPRLIVLAAGIGAAVVAVLIYVASVSTATAQQGAARGAMVFQNNCQICHGVNAQGRIGPPLNEIPPEVASLPRDEIVKELTGLIRGGIPGAMPRFVPELISDADAAALTDFLLENASKKPAGRGFYEALAPMQPFESTDTRTYFPQTQHSVANGFKGYWEQNGGLATFGYPITEEYVGFTEAGELVVMQDFERARFEYRSSDNSVQAALLGSYLRDIRMHFLTREGGPPGGPPEGPPGGPMPKP